MLYLTNKPRPKGITPGGGLHKAASGSAQTWPLAALLLGFAVAFNLYHLYPEVAIRAPLFNDGVLHWLALKQTVAALVAGQNPTDGWLGTITLGYPLFHHYQHLAYLPPALLYGLSGQTLPLDGLFHWTRYLLLAAFPLSIFWSMRRVGFSRLSAAMAGLLASLIGTNGLFGLEFGSYVWRGSGLYTQLWGMLLLPPALAQGYVTLRTGRGYAGAALLLAATLLTHLVFGYIAVISLAVIALIPNPASKPGPGGSKPLPLAGGSWEGVASPHDLSSRPWENAGVRLLRLALLLALLGLVAAYFLLPFWLDRAYMNRSVWEEAGKYDSYGHQWVLTALVQGELFDFGRFPALTLLAGLGLARCLWRWREARYRWPVVLALLWLLLYFGRPTWGPLLNLLPLSNDLHFHRLIAGVHLGGVLLMGLGLAWPWEGALAGSNPKYLWPVAALTALLLYPVYAERADYLAQNKEWLAQGEAALAAETSDLEALTATLRDLPPGRVYAGLGNNWGRDYKVGAAPMYALLAQAGLDNLGYLYHALSLNADMQALFDENRLDHYHLFNVRYVVAPIERAWPDFAQPVQTFGRHRLYQVNTNGYFDLVDTDIAFSGYKEDLFPAASGWLNSALLPAQQHPAICFEPGATMPLTQLPLAQADKILPQLEIPTPLYRGQIVSEEAANSAYQANVTVARPNTLMLKATYHPGWQAEVDGQAVAPLMVMPSFIGIPLEPGRHQVQLSYQADSRRSLLSVFGLLGLGLVALLEWRGVNLSRRVGWSTSYRRWPVVIF
ncbi:MAG: YfhO family protein [Anaerolineae bacterium]|nr:YfhO family protein [Anaerolineae bacterium]